MGLAGVGKLLIAGGVLAAGYGVVKSLQPIPVPRPPPGLSPQARIAAELRNSLDAFKAHRLILVSSGSAIARLINTGAIRSPAELLSAIDTAAMAEAEAAVGGPVTQDIVAIAVRTDRPVREVAGWYKHSHLYESGTECRVTLGIGAGVKSGRRVASGRGIGINAATMADARERQAAAADCAPRWHSHTVTPRVTIGIQARQTQELVRAINAGTPPPAHFKNHRHATNLNFRTGKLVYPNAAKEDEDFLDQVAKPFEEAYGGLKRGANSLGIDLDSVAKTVWAATEALGGDKGISMLMLGAAMACPLCAVGAYALSGPKHQKIMVDLMMRSTVARGIDLEMIKRGDPGAIAYTLYSNVGDDVETISQGLTNPGGLITDRLGAAARATKASLSGGQPARIGIGR